MLVVIAVCVLMAIPSILRHVGLVSAPRAGAEFGSYTIDERLNNVVGYLWLSFVVLYSCGLAYAHFDHKRRMYKTFDRILDPFLAGVLKVFGVHEK
jgi:hypothetical protein